MEGNENEPQIKPTAKMKTAKLLVRPLSLVLITAVSALLAAGCRSAGENAANQPAPAATPSPAAAAAEAKPAAQGAPQAIRIKAGSTDGFTDSQGHHWLPDEGFVDGETIERPDLTIANTVDPQIYRAERYSMTGFTQALPNGKYLVKLHFCETFEGITGPGQRVFSFTVAGHEFKDFDVWVKAGGPLRAYIETVPVDITNGKLEITFTPNIENPQINGIEIIPATE